jgi:hypothetical protein
MSAMVDDYPRNHTEIEDAFQDACTLADAEEARRSELDEVARLAKLSKLEYDRRREEAAAHLGVRVATLDKAVREKRSADHDAATLPHWQVDPWPLPVDGAKLLDAFRQVTEASGDGSKNRNLSYSDVGSDASALRKLGNGGQSNFAATETLSDDPGPIPEFLRRHPDRRCDHCGGQLGIMNRWDWLGRLDGIWLHPRCEEPWHDSARNNPVLQ